MNYTLYDILFLRQSHQISPLVNISAIFVFLEALFFIIGVIFEQRLCIIEQSNTLMQHTEAVHCKITMLQMRVILYHIYIVV